MNSRGLVLVVFLCALPLAGCIFGSSEPARFYLLTPIETATATTESLGVSVRIHAVELPKHLDSSEIVTRIDGNRIERAEFDRWGGPLSDNFARVLAKNLATLIPSDEVVRFSWEGRGDVDFHVTVAVLRFDTAGEESVLEARWSLSTKNVRETLVTKRSEFVHSVGGGEEARDYGAIARAMSAGVEDLSREIANAIRAQPRK